MAVQDFDRLVSGGLLRQVEEIVVDAYLNSHPGASRPEAYHWLHYEDPDPVARLADAVRKLGKEDAPFDGEAVDKACTEASKLGYSN
ncbi:MAG TPA: hypothetical protein VFR33_02415 [Candidatus Dormibacteraeota bacterium]|nr:hypothetical protein [Candidatus Dormibacteraeota bacterium]